METEGSYPYSQQPATGPSPDSNEPSLQPPFYFFKVKFSIFSLFWKIKGGSWDHLLLSVLLCIPPNFCSETYEITQLSCVCMCAYNAPLYFFVLYPVRVVPKENKQFVLLRTSCDITFQSMTTSTKFFLPLRLLRLKFCIHLSWISY
jgi:hypothetical protein